MGSEALSKQARRDLRRAYAPEASEEVLKFVDGVKADLDTRLALITARLDTADRRLDQMFEVMQLLDLDQRLDALKLETALALDEVAARQDRFVKLTFRQRLSWLWRGSWA